MVAAAAMYCGSAAVVASTSVRAQAATVTQSATGAASQPLVTARDVLALRNWSATSKLSLSCTYAMAGKDEYAAGEAAYLKSGSVWAWLVWVDGYNNYPNSGLPGMAVQGGPPVDTYDRLMAAFKKHEKDWANNARAWICLSDLRRQDPVMTRAMMHDEKVQARVTDKNGRFVKYDTIIWTRFRPTEKYMAFVREPLTRALKCDPSCFAAKLALASCDVDNARAYNKMNALCEGNPKKVDEFISLTMFRKALGAKRMDESERWKQQFVAKAKAHEDTPWRRHMREKMKF